MSIFLLTQHLAASGGFENIVQFLIQEGVDVNVTGKVLLYSLTFHIPLHSLTLRYHSKNSLCYDTR